MVSLLLLVLILGACYGAWRLAARSPRQFQRRPKLWELAVLIGGVRIGALWLGLAGLRGHGRAQVWGHGLLMIGLPEIYLAKSARAEPIKWAIFATLILAVSSFVWAEILIWVAARLPPPDESAL